MEAQISEESAHVTSTEIFPSSSTPQLEGDPQPPASGTSYRLNFFVSDVVSTRMSDEAWSCLVMLVTFWFFASMTFILGFYSSMNLHLGPNCSRLLQANSFFVQKIKVKADTESTPGPMLYGFSWPPALSAEVTWSETHTVIIPVNYHQEWMYYLNEGSHINVSYKVKSKGSQPLSLVIAQGKDSLSEWIEDPSYANTTLSWNIISGNGSIQQEIFRPSNYYVAVGNLNAQDVEVQLQFSIHALLYNTTTAYFKCSLNHNLCGLKLFIFGANAAVLTTPGPQQGRESDDWYVNLSYGPRWVTYFVGSGVMTIIILLAFRVVSKFQNSHDDTDLGENATTRAPLLHKDDDISSWGSSYDSLSHEDEDLEEQSMESSFQANLQKDGDVKSPRLCVICCDAPRDCFFLPCGHCAACFSCGARIAEDAGSCPICRRKMKKVKKIFAV